MYPRMFIATLSLRGKMATTQMFNERYIIKHIIASTKNATHTSVMKCHQNWQICTLFRYTVILSLVLSNSRKLVRC